MSTQERYYGRCHYYKHPGKMTLKQIKDKHCGEKGCWWFEEFHQLSARYINNLKAGSGMAKLKEKKRKMEVRKV
jgi:hypothetical protein